eukprot:414900_1
MGCCVSGLLHAYPKSGSLEIWVRKPGAILYKNGIYLKPGECPKEYKFQLEDIQMTIAYKFSTEINNETEFKEYVIKILKEKWSNCSQDNNAKRHLPYNIEEMVANIGYVEMKFQQDNNDIWCKVDEDEEIFSKMIPWQFKG